MLTKWNTGWRDLDEVFSSVSQLRQQMDRVFDSGSTRHWEDNVWRSATWPRVNLIDAGSSFILTAEIPGLTDKDVQITLNQDVLNLSGERKVDPPEGYSVHRQERRGVAFARSFTLPCRVNPEKTTAAVKDGVLTITAEKAIEAMPRQIKVGAQAS